MTHRARRALRGVTATATVALSGAVAAVAGGVLVPAAADTPASWETAPDVSTLEALLVVLLIPIAAALVIATLTVLPTLARRRSYEPGQPWRGEAEWFGGPTKGVAAAEEASSGQIDTGGTSARW